MNLLKLKQLLCFHQYVSPEGEYLAVRRWVSGRSGRHLAVTYDLVNSEYIHYETQLRDGKCVKCGKVRLDAMAFHATAESLKNTLALAASIAPK